MDAPPPPPPHSNAPLGLGYSIATALAFLVLFSALLLSSYICHRRRRRNSRNLNDPHHRRNSTNSDLNNSNSTTTTYLPRIIFVSEEDDDDGGGSNPQNAVVGLDQAAIESYPKFAYRKGGQANCDAVCPICLCEYRESEMLRMLPDCRHSFHLTCVDAWLKLSGSCPVCRNSPLPTPMSTPLQEVVPLSQYADGRRRG